MTDFATEQKFMSDNCVRLRKLSSGVLRPTIPRDLSRLDRLRILTALKKYGDEFLYHAEPEGL